MALLLQLVMILTFAEWFNREGPLIRDKRAPASKWHWQLSQAALLSRFRSKRMFRLFLTMFHRTRWFWAHLPFFALNALDLVKFGSELSGCFSESLRRLDDYSEDDPQSRLIETIHCIVDSRFLEAGCVNNVDVNATDSKQMSNTFTGSKLQLESNEIVRNATTTKFRELLSHPVY